MAIINSITTEKRALEKLLIALKEAAPEARSELLNQFTTVSGAVQLGKERRCRQNEVQTTDRDNGELQSSLTSRDRSKSQGVSDDEGLVDIELDASQFLSVDECGQLGVFGPTSALHSPVKGHLPTALPIQDVRNQLIANAALQRQREFSLRSLPEIDGVPTELAMHLLDLHWNRSHHTFLLTYRPAFTRDLISGGPYTSTFLLNAVFASASKYSSRSELRDDPSDPRTSGARFFRRCAEVLVRDNLFERSSIPSIVGLLLLGSAFLARGELSKSWLYSGLALRMVYDLGLHLDCRQPGCDAEDLEIRRRVFWGAFIWDKLQSLYLGRPFAIPLRDAHVTIDFVDTMEELDLWTPYIDAKCLDTNWSPCEPTPIHSVTTFQQFCLLSKLMTEIIQSFYFVGANTSNAQAKLQSLDKGLSSWYRNLPNQLCFQPWSEDPALSDKRVSPNIIILNTTYHSVVILLHRPFMSEGHLRSICPPANSWKKCTLAAKHITSIMRTYRSAYTLRGAPYLASYASYVACTIHVREAALEYGRGASTRPSFRMLEETLVMLDELSVASPCISGPTKIIRRLMEANRVHDLPCKCVYAMLIRLPVPTKWLFVDGSCKL